jgi:hypothetical protein
MIKANELRLGNWVYKNYSSPIFDIDVVTYDTFKIMDEDGWINRDTIPLTPKILESCGFIYSGLTANSEWFYKLISLQTNHMNVTYELNLFTTDEIGKFGVNLEEQYFGYCKYLHHLQNLYFALTHNELEIK